MTRIERLRQAGILRLGTKESGFRYRRADGRAVTPEDRARIDELAIPPAWTDVAIAGSAQSAIQAIGRDAAGRWQYRYSEAHDRLRETRKFARIVRFAEALPRMRRRVNADLSRRGLPRERVLAAVLRILSTSFLRPGSREYAEENGSFGIATLRKKHAKVSGDTVLLDFPGKSGKRQVSAIHDARVARVVRRCLLLRGPAIFQYEGADGQPVAVRRRTLNAYIKDCMGESYSAKDFRTWAGTLLAACALAKSAQDAEVRSMVTRRKRAVVEAIRRTAEVLGNTPAVCRQSYIAPALFDQFERGRVVERWFDDVDEFARREVAGLDPAERALLALLRRAARAPGAPRTRARVRPPGRRRSSRARSGPVSSDARAESAVFRREGGTRRRYSSHARRRSAARPA